MKIIYVDDELAAREKFLYLAAQMEDNKNIAAFCSGAEAIAYAEQQVIDIAVLDISMPDMSGLQLAKRLRSINDCIRIVFLTAYDNYALEAFAAGGIGYLLKPYDKKHLAEALQNAASIQYVSEKVYICTMPYFEVFLAGNPLVFSSDKAKEMLAVLVYLEGVSATQGQLIACLWEDRPNDNNTQSLCRVTYHRLKRILNEAGIGFLLGSDKGRRFVRTNLFQSDYKLLFAGDAAVQSRYDGRYMAQYSWAEMGAERIRNFIAKKSE